MTCCFFSSFKTLLTIREDSALPQINVLDVGLMVYNWPVLGVHRGNCRTNPSRQRPIRLCADCRNRVHACSFNYDDGRYRCFDRAIVDLAVPDRLYGSALVVDLRSAAAVPRVPAKIRAGDAGRLPRLYAAELGRNGNGLHSGTRDVARTGDDCKLAGIRTMDAT